MTKTYAYMPRMRIVHQTLKVPIARPIYALHQALMCEFNDRLFVFL